MARKVTASSIELVALGHALVKGARGEAGGAPSKDSIWGIAKVGGEMITFSGRREGKLRIMVESGSEADLLATFKAKKAGLGMTYHYADVTKKAGKVVPDLMERLVTDYNDAKAGGKINTRKMPLMTATKLKDGLRAMKTAA